MAPREAKETPKVQRTIVKSSTTRKSICTVVKKTMSSTKSSSKKTIERTPVKAKSATGPSQEKIKALATPKPKENKPVPCPNSVTKSAKKSWKRRPKPAHSGVPVPEKMKRLLQQQLQDSDSEDEASD